MTTVNLMSNVPEFDTPVKKDSRWDYPSEQVELLETSARLLINETKEVPEFSRLWSADERARATAYLLDIQDHVNKLLQSINRKDTDNATRTTER